MNECIDSLGEDAVFLTLDADNGYCQVEIDDADQNKTTSTYYPDFFRFIHMRFRLRDVPGIFQRAMHVILSSVG